MLKGNRVGTPWFYSDEDYVHTAGAITVSVVGIYDNNPDITIGGLLADNYNLRRHFDFNPNVTIAAANRALYAHAFMIERPADGDSAALEYAVSGNIVGPDYLTPQVIFGRLGEAITTTPNPYAIDGNPVIISPPGSQRQRFASDSVSSSPFLAKDTILVTNTEDDWDLFAYFIGIQVANYSTTSGDLSGLVNYSVGVRQLNNTTERRTRNPQQQ